MTLCEPAVIRWSRGVRSSTIQATWLGFQTVNGDHLNDQNILKPKPAIWLTFEPILSVPVSASLYGYAENPPVSVEIYAHIECVIPGFIRSSRDAASVKQPGCGCTIMNTHWVLKTVFNYMEEHSKWKAPFIELCQQLNIRKYQFMHIMINGWMTWWLTEP